MDAFETKIQALTPAKALAILSYGESVAAYRYRTLCERTDDPRLQRTFQEMADSEQEHNELIQRCLRERYPGADFILTAEDKEMVTVGTRLLELARPDAMDEAIRVLHESELQTGRFYAALYQQSADDGLRKLFKEMADECVDHARELMDLIQPGAGEATSGRAPGA